MKKPEKEDWMQKKWRPMMAIMYMAVCASDFIIFPIMFTIVQFWETQAANDAFRQWQPITLLGGGLFHLAMGAVLGVSAWSRGQEKMAGVAGGSSQPSSMMPTSVPAAMPVSYSPPAPTYQQTERTFESMTPVQSGYKGKKAPAEPQYPEI